jgi:hypothetical protein
MISNTPAAIRIACSPFGVPSFVRPASHPALTIQGGWLSSRQHMAGSRSNKAEFQFARQQMHFEIGTIFAATSGGVLPGRAATQP